MVWLDVHARGSADYGAAPRSRAGDTSPSDAAPGAPRGPAEPRPERRDRSAAAAATAQPPRSPTRRADPRSNRRARRLGSTSHGGDLVRADLLAVSRRQAHARARRALARHTARSAGYFKPACASAVGGAEPNHLATFRSASNEYALAPGQDELVVTLDWVGDGPISARKTYTFRRGRIRRSTSTLTPSRRRPAAAGAARRTRRWCACTCPSSARTLSVDSYSFTGPVLYDGDEFEKLDFEDLARDAGHADRAGRLARGDPASLPRGGRAAAAGDVSLRGERRAARSSC